MKWPYYGFVQYPTPKPTSMLTWDLNSWSCPQKINTWVKEKFSWEKQNEPFLYRNRSPSILPCPLQPYNLDKNQIHFQHNPAHSAHQLHVDTSHTTHILSHVIVLQHQKTPRDTAHPLEPHNPSHLEATRRSITREVIWGSNCHWFLTSKHRLSVLDHTSSHRKFPSRDRKGCVSTLCLSCEDPKSPIFHRASDE